jgi:hypothetical protein
VFVIIVAIDIIQPIFFMSFTLSLLERDRLRELSKFQWLISNQRRNSAA